MEYEDPEPMEQAIKSMDRFDLGGKTLRVGPCVVPPSLQNITTSRHADLKVGWPVTFQKFIHNNLFARGDIFTDKRKTADKPLIRGKNHFSFKFWGEISPEVAP